MAFKIKNSLRVITAVFLAACLLFTARSAPAAAQNTQNFTFDSFSADYYLNRQPDHSSAMTIFETLVAQFPNYDQNHGILRAIPESYQGHTLSLDIKSVTDGSGNPYQYTTSSQNQNKVLKIGDPNKFVHGRVTYRIGYTYKDVVSFYQDHDELFWDINGDQWDQPFGAVTANFHISRDLADNLNADPVCYVGSAGSHDKSRCNLSRYDNSNVPASTTFTAVSKGQINNRETMSVGLSFKPGTFTYSPAIAKEKRNQQIQTVLAVCLGIIIPLATFIYMFRRWRLVGNDPKGRGVIVPQYTPPKGWDPLYSDYLLHEKTRPVAISALLIDLAIKGHLTIIEVPKKGIFGHTSYQIKVNQLPPNLTGAQTVALDASLGGARNPGATIDLEALAKDTTHKTAAYQDYQQLGKDLAAELHAQGYFQKDPRKIKLRYLSIGGSVLAVLLVGGGAIFSAGITALYGLYAGVLVSSLIVLGFSFIMPARSDKGVEIYDWLLGLRDYIKLAEADRIKFLQSPQGAEKFPEPDQFNPKDPAMRVKLFEKLLPYAMLFGLEKEWAKQFNDVYTTPPGWYSGNWTAFNAGYLAGSLSDFNSVGGKTFAAPTSGGSAFSGGGAGGGGGGGGGGGW